MGNLRKPISAIMTAALLLSMSGCGSKLSESYKVSDEYLYKEDTEIGYFNIYEEDDITSSIDKDDFDSPIDAFLKVMYVSDYSVADERKIAANGDYTLEYVELNVEPTAAMGIQGEKTSTEWHYFIYEEDKYIMDVTVFEEKDCTEELEGYLEEYMNNTMIK